MKKTILVGVSVIAMLVTLTFLVFIPDKVVKSNIHSLDTLLLLTPVLTKDKVLVQAWQNIAAEEGIHLEVQTVTEFLLPLHQKNIYYQGIILPDTLHARMSRTLALALKTYVKNGGQLLLVYDAGTQSPNGRVYKEGSLFKDALHFEYGVRSLGFERGAVGNSKGILNDMGIPPGKCIVDTDNSITIPNDVFCGISTYGYGRLVYSHFVTKPIKEDIPLLLTTPDHQFIAGVRPYGLGRILFVNLPLTYLWFNTDSMLLHAFLRYFAKTMLDIATLSTVPNGIGGLILSLHAESKDASEAFPVLEKIGLFEQGPYSIDFTVGPDLDVPGDNKGFDILHDNDAQYWIKYLAKLGNAIGSDGGWMHNYFGTEVSDENQQQFQAYIEMNNAAIEKILSQKVLEYVPSMGNQPTWVTNFLTREGFLGYYSTSNTGAAPTINFRKGVFDSPGLWSFPCLPLGEHASLRDFGFAHLPVSDVTKWLNDSTDFVALNHTSRLIYFHPSDVLFFNQYLDSLKSWLSKTKAMHNSGNFQWYTMVDMAQFLNRRKGVYWQVNKKSGLKIIIATHSESLAHQSWLLGKKSCNKPVITMGSGSVREERDTWIITAGQVKTLQFQCTEKAMV